MGHESAEQVRFKRAQKFRLSSTGSEAAAAYAQMIEAARAGTGRAQFDAARASWGAPRGLAVEDGLFLVEFGRRDQTIPEVARNLESCGTTAKEVKAAVERLLGCGMLEPVPTPEEIAPPASRYRW
jgi:hypothetical protein